MKKVLPSILLLALSLIANEIKSVTFEGLIHISPQIASELTGLKKGKKFTYELSDNAIKKLYAQGYFTDIWIEEDDGHIVVYTQEKPIIALVDYDGISDDDKKALKEILGLNKGMVYDKNSIDSAKTKIIKYFEAKGYFDTVVEEFSSQLKEKTSLKVLFKVNRGENVIINSITLSGSKELNYDDIEPSIVNKQREFLGWMWGFNDGKLRLEALPTDPMRIQDEYLTRGYLDIEVSNPYLKLYYDNYEASIIYNIDEGKQYKVKSVSIYLPENLIDTEKTIDEFYLSKGDIFNVKKLRKDIDLLKTKIADKGYAYVKIYPDTLQDKEENTVEIRYNVILGDIVHVNKVIIGGNTRTADHVIRREMYLAEGDLYNKTELDESRKALKRTGYFDDVSINEKQISKDKIDLYINIKEAATGSIRGGIGYGTSQGLLFDIGVSDKNIFGSGLQGGINGSRSDDELSGRINLTNPRVFDSRYSLGGSLYAEDNDWDSYDEQIYGFSIGIGRMIGKHISANLRYIIEQTKLNELHQSLIDMGYEEGKSIKSAFVPSISYNNTDDYYLPRSGFIASTSLEYAGAGGDEKFIKSINNIKFFYGLEDLIDYDIILRYKARLRYIKDEGNLPINERLYLGGLGSVRGYDNRSIGPKNAKGYEFGGTKSFNNSFEVSFPLVKRLKMRWALFYDYGMIGTNKFDDFTRSSTGINLEWISPLGAINLIFAKAIDDKEGDDTSSFEFTIGRQF